MGAALDQRIEPPLVDDAEAPRSDRFLPPLPRISIQAFCETPQVHAALTEAAADRRAARAHMTVQTGGLTAAIESYSDAATPNVILLESSKRPAALLQELERFAELCDPGTRVIVVGHANDVSLYRELMQRGVSEYLVTPVDAGQALETLSGLFAAPGADPLGRTVAFIGAKGGVGSSTIAHNVAWAIAQDLLKDVVIADLDLPFGTAGLDFNQDPPQGIAEAVFARERLDEVYLERLLSKCTDHLSLMAAPAVLDKDYDLTADALEPVLDIIRKTVPMVVLDMPHLWSGWTRQTLLGADDIVIVAVPDLANLRNVKNMVDLLRQSRPNDRPPFLVLNQCGVPKKPEISVKDFAVALDLEPVATVPFEPQLFAAAANNGQMIAEMSGGAKPVETFRRLAEILSGRTEMRQKRRSPLAPLLERLKRVAG